MKNKITLLLLCCIGHLVPAQTKLWTPIAETAISRTGERLIIPLKYKTFHLETTDIRRILATVPHEKTTELKNSPAVIELPMPDGSLQKFRIVISPVVESKANGQKPAIQTYSAVGIDQPGTYGKLDYSESKGFHGILIDSYGTLLIDPYSLNTTSDYLSYYTTDFISDNKVMCLMKETLEQRVTNKKAPAAGTCVGPFLRTYRLALACTGEFAIALNGGVIPSPADLDILITGLVNKLNLLYETEVAIRFLLVANNSTVQFPDPASDAFTANNNAALLINESQRVIDSIIGDANYDIGHTLSGANLGGLALTFEIVCVQGKKASAISSMSTPLDPQFIPLIAHEIGHQFGCRHTFSRCTNYPAALTPDNTVEPGGGSTIMGYPGVCGPNDDITTTRMSYFHTFSYDQIMEYTTNGNGKNCAVSVASGNNAPIVDNIPVYTIPKLTPFELKGKATDPDNDVLTYSWEENDINNTPHNLGAAAPYFRSNKPVSSPGRIFPPISNVLLGQTSALGDYLPATAQTLNFRLTVRDNKTVGGGVCYASTQVNISGSGPFKITSQKTPETWAACTPQEIKWDVAGTDKGDVNTALVDIYLLLLDAAGTISDTLKVSSNIANNGFCRISVPVLNTNSARVMLKAVNNIYFAINEANITITGLCADFKAVSSGVDKSMVEIGGVIDFKDISVGNPTGWEWEFTGGTPDKSTEQHPQITYNTPGAYDVKLTITSGAAKLILEKKNYVVVNATYNKGQAFTSIAIDSNRNVWSGTDKKGLFFLNKKTTPAATQFTALTGSTDFTRFVIQSIACDTLGNAWIGHGGQGGSYAAGGGMERVDYNNTATVQHYSPDRNAQGFTFFERDGLATLNVQCVRVDKNGSVWTAHKAHDLLVTGPPTTDYYLTPGTVSYKLPAATLFTSKSTWRNFQTGTGSAELPYPAYTYNPPANKGPQSRTCNVVACGENEVWLSVYPYTYLNGKEEIYLPARILRYDLSGNFIAPSIDFTTVGVPTAGGVFNGIYLTPKGDAWVTIAGKGFGVRINGGWKFITPASMPCIFPEGANINQNAIWGNKFGNVFIGTTKGLIVYNGDGNVNSATSYSFYPMAKDGGDNRSVRGGVSEKDSIQWVATDDGIIRTIIGRYDMTKNDLDYTSCNNTDMNTIEAIIKSGEANKSYHSYEVITIIADKRTSKYPDHCTAEHVYTLLKKNVNLTAPTPPDYPTNILEIYRKSNSDVLFSLLSESPFEMAFDALTTASLSASQNSANPSNVISCRQEPYKLYNNAKAIVARYLYDKGPILRYFKDCNWVSSVLVSPFDYINSMDDYCGNQLLSVQYDPIYIFANDKKKILTNYTAKGHILYPGKIERTVVEECGVIKIITRGVGTQYCGDNCRGALMGAANKIIGEHLFREIDKRVKTAFENGQ